MFRSSPFARTRDVRLTGTLVAYRPLDSLRVARTRPAALFSMTPERTVYWSSVGQIDVPNGRNTLGGAAGGEKEQFPLKVWADCARCPRQDACDEVAVALTL